MNRAAHAAGIAVFVLAAPTGAEAYVRTRNSTGVAVAWDGRCAALELGREQNPAYPEPTLRDSLLAVITAWDQRSSGCGPLHVSLKDGTTAIDEVAYDGTSLIAWRLPGFCNDPANLETSICLSPNAAAVTTIFFVDSPGDPRDGELLEADIELNGIDFEFADDGDLTRMDMRNVLSHELGHLLGLDHTCYTLRGGVPPIDDNNDLVPYCYPLWELDPTVSEATMFNFAEPGEQKKRVPGDDEAEALCDLYAGRAAECSSPPPGCGCDVGARERRPEGLVALLALGLAALGVALGFRRERP